MSEHSNNNRVLGLVSVFILVSLISVIFSSGIVYAQIVINPEDIDMPLQISENSELEISFSASDGQGDIIYAIYMDDVKVSDSNNYTSFMDYSSAGVYDFTLFASDNESNTSTAMVLEVLDVPMILNLYSPQNKTYNSRIIMINLSVSTYANNCSYIVQGPGGFTEASYMINYVNLTGVGQLFNKSITLSSDGIYYLNATCSNLYDIKSSSSKFEIYTSNPVIMSKSYSIDSSNTVTLSATTDMSCTCRYDATDLPYDSMERVFSNTAGLQHSVSISGLPDGPHTYYVKCRNTNGLFSDSSSISFGIVTKPKASITLSKSSPLKAGTYEVNLKTSEPVITAPNLYYNFDTDTTARYVTLTGSERDWSGYIIIENNVPNKVGTFHYTATDFTNNVGNIITDGELFLVDTIKPIAPVSVDAEEVSDGNIKLRWYYDGEEVSRYNIYKASDGDPEYVDYIESTTSEQFIDEDVIDGVTYYYRIAAVDRAGNDGLLSYAIQATSTKLSSSRSSSNEIDSSESDNSIYDSIDTGDSSTMLLDIKLVPKVDSLVSEFNNYLLDIDPVKSEISAITDPNKLKIITALGLIDDINSAKSRITELKGQAEALKLKNLKQSDLDIQLNKIRMDAIKAKSMVAEDIIVVEQSSYDQITQESDVDSAISEAVLVNLSRKVLDDYSDANMQLQDNIVVKTDILMFKIKYLGKDDYDKYTLVKKVVSSSQEFRNLSIIEIVPKSFESDASDISFDIDGQDLPVIVNDDPVFRWDVDSLGSKTIYYMINSNAELLSAKGTRTIVLYRPDFSVTQTAQDLDDEDYDSGNRLTGFVSADLVDLGNFSPIQWMVLIGVGIILGLSTYYVMLDKKSKKYATQRLKDHRIITRPAKPLESKDSAVRNTIINPGNDSRNVHLKKTAIKNGTHLVNGAVSNNATVTNTVINNNAANMVSGSKGVNNSKNILAETSPYMSPDIVANLDRVNELINMFDYESARLLFNQCLKQYKSYSFKNVSVKNTVMLTMNHLYTKLLVYKAIYDSRKHVLARNHVELKKDSELIDKAYAKLRASLSSIDEDYLEDEKKFLSYVISSRRHVNKLKR